jgi:peptidoglycan-N-acetylglucosamine deacetylase
MILYISGFIIVASTMYYLFFSSTSQIFGVVKHSLDTTDKVIALTFDDGPNEPYTSQMLDILDGHGVKATFFVCGVCIERWPGIVANIYSRGHTVGNHSHAHKFGAYFDMSTYKEAVKSTNELIESETGQKPILYRSPWLFRTPGLLKYVYSIGMQPIWGTFGSELEVFQPNPKTMADRALQLTKPGRIFIFHDGKEGVVGNRANTIAAVDLLIPQLKQKGYSFVRVADL